MPGMTLCEAAWCPESTIRRMRPQIYRSMCMHLKSISDLKFKVKFLRTLSEFVYRVSSTQRRFESTYFGGGSRQEREEEEALFNSMEGGGGGGEGAFGCVHASTKRNLLNF